METASGQRQRFLHRSTIIAPKMGLWLSISVRREWHDGQFDPIIAELGMSITVDFFAVL